MAASKSNDFINLKKLKSQIKSSIVTSSLDDYDKFLPEGILKRLIVPENVRLGLPNLSPESVDFICDHAKKTFTILLFVCSRNIVPVIESFQKFGFTDDFLPIDENTDMDNCEVESKRKCSHKDALNVFHHQPWTSARIEDFYLKQWEFLAPVFEKEQTIYNLHYKSPLPFTQIGRIIPGRSSDVQEVEIHEDYQKLHPLIDGNQPHFALKKFRDTDSPPFKIDNYQASVATMSALNHPYLQNAIAITKPGQLYILLDWADGGTLEDFWKRIASPTLDNDFILDLLQQFLGLADAVRVLDDNHIKYGVIKPDNIFRFKNNNKIGVLQTSCSRRLWIPHNSPTSSQIARTPLDRYDLEHYLAPELSTSGPMERFLGWGPWSVGCLILESIIWLLFGYVQLCKFRDEINTNNKSRAAEEQRNTINRWLHCMYREPECKKATALGDLLHFVDKKLLIASPTWKEMKRLERKKTTGFAGLDLFRRMPLVTSPIIEEIQDPGITISIFDPDFTSTEDTEIEDTEIQYRASATQLYEEINRILQKAANDSRYLFTGAARDKIPGPGPLDTSKRTHIFPWSGSKGKKNQK